MFIIGGQLILLAQSDGSLSTALTADTETEPTTRNGEEHDQPSEYKKTKSNKSDVRGPLDENKDYTIAKVSSLNFLGVLFMQHPILNNKRNLNSDP